MENIDTVLQGTFKVYNLGRHKVNKTIVVNGDESFWSQIESHLMSDHLEYHYNTETEQGKIFAGLYHVGSFERIN